MININNKSNNNTNSPLIDNTSCASFQSSLTTASRFKYSRHHPNDRFQPNNFRDNDINNIYRQHPYVLTYTNDAVERRFFDYLYVNSHILGMKTHADCHTGDHPRLSYHDLSNLQVHAEDYYAFASSLACYLVIALTAIPTLKKHREKIWIGVTIFHATGFTLTTNFHKKTDSTVQGYNLAYILSTAVVCQVRICREFFVLVPSMWSSILLWGTLTDGYWQKHGWTIAIWCVPSVRQLYRPYTNVVMVVSD
eukprot:PhM_4_TR15193/c0_g1_i2/m.93783